MAVVKRNYIPGEFEELSKENAGVIAYDAFQYFAFEGYFKFDVAEIQVFATDAKTLVDPANYTLVIDQKYTDIEQAYSGLTLYSMIKFTDPGLDGEPFWVTGKNFGTMVDNEEMKRYVDDLLSQVGGSSREFHATALVSGADWTNTATSVSITDGVGKIVNAYDDPSTPLETIVPIPAQTKTPTVPGNFTGNVFVYVDKDGFLQTQNAPLTYAQLRESFNVALAVYDLGSITEVFGLGIYVNNFLNVLRDYINFLPLVKRINGVQIREVTGVLSLWYTQGEFFLPGGNRKATKKSENVIPIAQGGDEVTPVAFTVIDQYGNVISTNATVVPKSYDAGGGSVGSPNVVNLTGQKATIHYFFYQADGGIFLQLGQVEYATSGDALKGLEKDARDFVRAERVLYAVARAQIYLDAPATGFNDIDSAGIVNIGETGGKGGAGGLGLGEVLANSPDANEIDIVNLLGMRTSGVINQSGLWQIRKPAGSGSASDFDVSGSSSEAVNGSYTENGAHGGYPKYENGEGFFIARIGWWWLICADVNDAWNTGAHYGAGGLETPAGFYQPITANGFSGNAEVVISGGSTEVDSLVAEGTIYGDEVIKSRLGFNVANSLAVQKDRIEFLNLASLFFNADGTITLPNAEANEIRDSASGKVALTREALYVLSLMVQATKAGNTSNHFVRTPNNGSWVGSDPIEKIIGFRKGTTGDFFIANGEIVANVTNETGGTITEIPAGTAVYLEGGPAYFDIYNNDPNAPIDTTKNHIGYVIEDKTGLNLGNGVTAPNVRILVDKWYLLASKFSSVGSAGLVDQINTADGNGGFQAVGTTWKDITASEAQIITDRNLTIFAGGQNQYKINLRGVEASIGNEANGQVIIAYSNDAGANANKALAPNLTETQINSGGARSLVTKEYVDNKAGGAGFPDWELESSNPSASDEVVLLAKDDTSVIKTGRVIVSNDSVPGHGYIFDFWRDTDDDEIKVVGYGDRFRAGATAYTTDVVFCTYNAEKWLAVRIKGNSSDGWKIRAFGTLEPAGLDGTVLAFGDVSDVVVLSVSGTVVNREYAFNNYTPRVYREIVTPSADSVVLIDWIGKTGATAVNYSSKGEVYGEINGQVIRFNYWVDGEGAGSNGRSTLRVSVYGRSFFESSWEMYPVEVDRGDNRYLGMRIDRGQSGLNLKLWVISQSVDFSGDIYDSASGSISIFKEFQDYEKYSPAVKNDFPEKYDFGWSSNGKYIGTNTVYVPVPMHTDLSYSGFTGSAQYADYVRKDSVLTEFTFFFYGIGATFPQHTWVEVVVNGSVVGSYQKVAGTGTKGEFSGLNISLQKGDELIFAIRSTATGITIDGVKVHAVTIPV